MQRRRFSAGSVIFKQGDTSQEVYRVVSGRVEVGIDQGDGEHVILASLGEEDVFGEMAMIDESPRSATVTVVEDCDLEVMDPGDFTETFFTNPVVLAPYLACLIDRLRTANEKVFDLTKKLTEKSNGVDRAPLARRSSNTLFTTGLVLVPKSLQAKKTLANPRVPISKFPFRIGRSGGKGTDLLQRNDLSLINVDPSQVAKNHISIEQEDGAVWIRDRKSRRGTIVNGRRLHQDDGALVCRLTKSVNEIVLGDEKSPAVYELRTLQA